MLATGLRHRLILASILWIAIGTGLAGLALSEVFHRHLDTQFRDELSVHLDELEGLTSLDAAGSPTLTRPLSDPRYYQNRSGYYWEIRNGDAVVAHSPSLGEGTILPHPETSEDGQLHFHEFAGPTGDLLLAERIHRRSDVPLRFMVSTDKRHFEAVMGSFHSTLIRAMTAFAISLALAALLLLVFALRPLAQLRGDLTKVRTGATSRLGGSYPEEVRPLVEDLNAMIESTTRSVEMARVQAGNMAHGLKTPLAVVTGEAYALGESGHSEAADIILDQCRRMQVHINYQLARARAAGNKAAPGTITAVAPIADAVCSALRRLHEGRGISIDNRVQSPDDTAHQAPLEVACDAQDLNEMIANLVDNGCKHAARQVTVSASRVADAKATVIIVDDDGPGLPPDAYEVVFNIGERWDSNAQGAGLGLPIVRDLAQLYGGSIALAASPLGGLQARLKLPAPDKTGT